MFLKKIPYFKKSLNVQTNNNNNKKNYFSFSEKNTRNTDKDITNN